MAAHRSCTDTVDPFPVGLDELKSLGDEDLNMKVAGWIRAGWAVPVLYQLNGVQHCSLVDHVVKANTSQVETVAAVNGTGTAEKFVVADILKIETLEVMSIFFAFFAVLNTNIRWMQS